MNADYIRCYKVGKTRQLCFESFFVFFCLQWQLHFWLLESRAIDADLGHSDINARKFLAVVIQVEVNKKVFSLTEPLKHFLLLQHVRVYPASTVCACTPALMNDAPPFFSG